MSSWTSGQVVTEALANQKFILVQAAAPSTAHEGQVWCCTSSDPLLVKSYDDTNTAWVTNTPVWYKSNASFAPPVDGKNLNGSLTLRYDSGESKTYLWLTSNVGWKPVLKET